MVNKVDQGPTRVVVSDEAMAEIRTIINRNSPKGPIPHLDLKAMKARAKSKQK